MQGPKEKKQREPEANEFDFDEDLTNEEDQSSAAQRSSGQAKEWWPPDEPGSRMALEMLELLEDMGVAATAPDLAELSMVCMKKMKNECYK